MSDPQVLAQIARLEQELARIQDELTELRARVGGPSSAAPRRRTQTFAAVAPSAREASAREAPTRELPAQSEPPLERPTPAVPTVSETVPTLREGRPTNDDRRHAGRRTGLTEFPPSDAADSVRPTHPSAPRVRLEDQAGRYVYFDETAPRDGKSSKGRR